jgi:hypothetical protein
LATIHPSEFAYSSSMAICRSKSCFWSAQETRAYRDYYSWCLFWSLDKDDAGRSLLNRHRDLALLDPRQAVLYEIPCFLAHSLQLHMDEVANMYINIHVSLSSR